ncbi:CehA/McbA family metallohydrolase [Streptomyces sulphureus]|uniref:CehA/McbA family metallohydrolase n=1 Tax=Streptomyces sulphureus TaxID=47758 RepID=UPI00039F224C|nr:CehA/McbA family metallohydrolase [Streptomyces sulphureus]
MKGVVRSGVWTMEDRAASVLRPLPFEVPRHAGALTVSLDYPRGAGVLDLGALGPGGAFRGWSGGARDGFTVTEEWATPGYLPGRLAGDWQVLLRLHRVPPDGLPFKVRVDLSHRAPAPPAEEVPDPLPIGDRPVRRRLPAREGARWFAGDLHAHTVHSDGSLGVDELARLAASRGLDFLAVTDHNTVSHHAHLPEAARRQSVTLLPGQEVTTDLGHANAFGDIGWVDFRTDAGSWLAHAESAGGVLSVNHPLAADCAWELPFTGRRPRHAEVWHHSWFDRRHGAPLAWADAWLDGEALVPLGGSDFHRPEEGRPPGQPTTWVLAEENTPEALLAALAAGRTAVSPDLAGPLLLRDGEELTALDAENTVLVRPDGERTVVRQRHAVFPAGEGLHRLERYDCETVALCG